MVDSVYWIWFQLLLGAGTRRAELFLNFFGDPGELYDSLKSGGQAGVMLSQKEISASDKAMEQAKVIRQRTLRKGCAIITPDQPSYPYLLGHIYSKPAVLYVKGDLACLGEDRLPIAMVGTRRHTAYGERVATDLAGALAASGVTIVSGLARGIDTISHWAALNAGGSTVGVLGCGIDVDYPGGSSKLKSAMCEKGAVVSEFPLGTEPRPGNFPVRNRIISGMCRGVVVVEADMKSGSMITAGHAHNEGRDIFAVPNSILVPQACGGHALLRDGAKLVECPGDILEEYLESQVKKSGPGLYNSIGDRATIKESILPETAPEAPSPPPQGVSREAAAIYEALKEGPVTIMELAARGEWEMALLHTALTELEIYGLVENRPGRVFARRAH